MRRISAMFGLLLALLATQLPAHGQAYPARPVRIIVPFPAGSREPNRCGAAHGDVAACGDEAVTRELVDGGVDRKAFDDAVEVELRRRIAEHEPPGDPDVPPAAQGRRPRRRPVAGELGEVAVVSRRLDRRAERRVDEAVGARRRAQRDLDHLRELRGDGNDAPGGAVDAAQLAVGAEAAEGLLQRGEELLDRLELARRRAADDNLGSHRAEAIRRHGSAPGAGSSRARSRSRPSSRPGIPSSSRSRRSRRFGSFARCGPNA